MADPKVIAEYRINPAFERYHEEGQLVGTILASFGEIEYSVCAAASESSGKALQTPILKALYRQRMTSARLDAADAMLRPLCDLHGLGEDYRIAHAMVLFCVRIRNQYAHCMWGDEQDGGLFFTDLQDASEGEGSISLYWRHVDVPLLKEQLGYFCYAMEWSRYIRFEVTEKSGNRQIPYSWPKPLGTTQPPLHSPPELHVPPWLSEDGKALHVARARAAAGGPPTPTPAQQAQETKRAEKKARREADRKRGLEEKK